ncbi:hypothetical protein AB0G71_12295 [Streptomyces sp. NPDC020403]|uniref:hypothetical protein n=1 Tax=unclassified Streptomyces TaxID=2593676 RepID=UPI00340F70DB
MTFGPKSWSVGEVVTAAMLNEQIRDQFNSMFGAWTPYTPTWTAASNPSIGNGTLTGQYIKIGRTCHVVLKLTTGSTTTYGSGGYSFGVPFTSAAGIDYTGSARLVAVQAWHGGTIMSGGSSAFNATFPTSATDSRSASMAATVPDTLAAGHVLRASITYQTAT